MDLLDRPCRDFPSLNIINFENSVTANYARANHPTLKSGKLDIRGEVWY